MIPRFNGKIKGLEAGISTYLTIWGYPDAKVQVLFTADENPLAVIVCKGIPSYMRLQLGKMTIIQNINHKFIFR